MEKFIAVVILLAVAAGCVLGVWWIFWMLWCWVVPQVWPDGPAALVRPGYWLFAGLWLLLAWMGSVIFKSQKT